MSIDSLLERSAPKQLTAHAAGFHCVICDARVEPSISLWDDRYGYPGSYELLACVDCKHRTLNCPMSAQEISDLYTNYYPRSAFDVDAWSPPREESALRTWWSGLRGSAFRWVP